MIPGKRVYARRNIRLNEPALRIERSTSGPGDLKHLIIPENTPGDIIDTNAAGATLFFSFKAGKINGLYEFEQITLWVKREYFGNFFEYKN